MKIRVLIFVLASVCTMLAAMLDCWSVFSIGCVTLFVLNAIVKMD